MKIASRIIAALLLVLALVACEGTSPIDDVSRLVPADEYFAILDAISEEAAALPTALPETTGMPETTVAPETTETAEAAGDLVWIPTKGGTKYHSKPDCSGMADPVQVTRPQAEQDGYTACKRCH